MLKYKLWRVVDPSKKVPDLRSGGIPKKIVGLWVSIWFRDRV